MNRVRVELKEEAVQVTFTLPDRWAAQRLAQILVERGAFGPEPEKERRIWRVLAREMVRQIKEQTARPPRYQRVKRPPPGVSVPVDVDWVVHGQAPFPVLSATDMRDAYQRLRHLKVRGNPLSVTAIARRLHVSSRTVWRWEQAERVRARNGLS